MSDERTCAELEGAIVAVADGSATAEEAAAVRVHTTTCVACATALAEARALLGAVREANPPPEKAQAFWDDLHASVMAQVPAARPVAREPRPMGRVAMVAALAAVALVAAFYVAVRLRGGGRSEVAVAPDAAVPHERVAGLIDVTPQLDEMDEDQLSAVEAALDDEDVVASFDDVDDDGTPLPAMGPVEAVLPDLPPDALERLDQEL